MADTGADETVRETLRRLGFAGSSPTGVATAAAFSSGDCELFQRYPASVPWKSEFIPDHDQEAFKSIWARLKILATDLTPLIGTLPGQPELVGAPSLYAPSGRLERQPWCCVYPKDAENKSYALQVAFIISASGAELCLCLGAGKATINDPAKLTKAEKAWSRLQSRLASVPAEVVDAVENALPSSAVLRRSWRDPGSSQFASLKEWTEHAGGARGAKASVSVYLSTSDLDALGTRIAEPFFQMAIAAAPLFNYCYGITEPNTQGAMETVVENNEVQEAAAQSAEFDAEALQELAEADPHNLEVEPKVYRAVIAALRSGKHVILTGPPGTAKTTLAEIVGSLAHRAGWCSGSVLTTATSDWTTYDTIGGLRPAGNGSSLEFHDGLILGAIRKNQWVIIDELNRSNFDRALGQLFTVLSGQPVILPWERTKGKHIVLCTEKETRYSGSSYERVSISDSWRIIGTMNVFDKSLLFEMSLALMRRFAFVEVPSPKPEVFASLWNRKLKFAASDATETINETLSKLLKLKSVKDIGPAIFIDMAGFAHEYMTGGADVSADQLAFQLFYSYLLPQYEGITEQQGRDLFDQVDKITERNHTEELTEKLTSVLGIALPGDQIEDDELDSR